MGQIILLFDEISCRDEISLIKWHIQSSLQGTLTLKINKNHISMVYVSGVFSSVLNSSLKDIFYKKRRMFLYCPTSLILNLYSWFILNCTSFCCVFN